MTVISKNVYIDKLEDIVDKCNNTYHEKKVKPADIKSDMLLEYDVKHNDKFKVGDCVRISKGKNIYAKDCTANCSEAVFVIKKVKNAVPRKCIISDLNGEETVETFHCMKNNIFV